MKKVTLTLLLLSSLTALKAQFSVGMAGGLNISTVSFVNVDYAKPDMRFGYFVSVLPKYHLNQKMSVNLESQYSVVGYDNTNVITIKNRFQYVTLAPQFEYRPTEAIGVYSGIAWGYKIAEAIRADGSDWTSTKDTPFIKDTDLGALLGVRGYFDNIYFTAGFNYGIKNISNIFFTDGNGNNIPDAKQKNVYLQIGVGYLFLKE